MDFLARIDADIKEAMKAKQAARLDVVRMLKSALKYAAIEKGESLFNDADAQVVLRKEIKKRQDSIESFQKGNRPELAAKEAMELEFLTPYLPSQLSTAELDALVRSCVAELQATSKQQMGAVMKLVMQKAEGRADGKAVSAAVSAILSA